MWPSGPIGHGCRTETGNPSMSYTYRTSRCMRCCLTGWISGHTHLHSVTPLSSPLSWTNKNIHTSWLQAFFNYKIPVHFLAETLDSPTTGPNWMKLSMQTFSIILWGFIECFFILVLGPRCGISGPPKWIFKKPSVKPRRIIKKVYMENVSKFGPVVWSLWHKIPNYSLYLKMIIFIYSIQKMNDIQFLMNLIPFT